jgi:hypothetical protein
MTALSKSALKALWKAYFQPTSADFSNLIDSWADYSPFIASFTAAVSGGSTGIVKAVSPTTAQFLPSGAFGESMLAATTTAAAQSILNISYPVSVANGGTGVASLSANHVVLGNGTSAVQLVAPGASGNVLTSNGTTWASQAPSSSSKLVQQVYAEYSAFNSGTTTIPFDDTIPQNTEGTEFMSVTITPTSVSNYLLIEVNAMLLGATAMLVAGAVFRDSIADALAAGFTYVQAANAGAMLTIQFRIPVPTTSSTTFKFRAGPNGSTLYFNGYTARYFGAIPKSTMTVTEIAP